MPCFKFFDSQVRLYKQSGEVLDALSVKSWDKDDVFMDSGRICAKGLLYAMLGVCSWVVTPYIALCELFINGSPINALCSLFFGPVLAIGTIFRGLAISCAPLYLLANHLLFDVLLNDRGAAAPIHSSVDEGLCGVEFTPLDEDQAIPACT